jgi:hypothetical protein
MEGRSQPDDRPPSHLGAPAGRPLHRGLLTEARKGVGGRKVRTPQGGAPANGRAGKPDGKWHRKHTAFAEPVDVGSSGAYPSQCAATPKCTGSTEVRVKRCGKSAPRRRQRRWQAKPRTEQDQIGWCAAGSHRSQGACNATKRCSRRKRATCPKGARLKPPGRSLEPASNRRPRGMIVPP